MIERLKSEMDGVCAIIDDSLSDSDSLIRSPINQTVQQKGKLFRPMLLVLTSKCRNYDEKSAVTAAAALELMHIASLIHDDVVDDGTMRRGTVSVQSKFGKDVAVYAGDYTLARSIHVITKLDDITLVKMFGQAINNMCRGELSQYACRHKVVSTQEYIKIVSNKTGVLFELSLETGGYIAGIGNDVCVELRNIGRMFGIAYQIYDDCLDYTFTNSKALKDTQKDIIQGSYTAPLLCAMELDNLGKLENLLKKSMTEEVIDEIQQTVRDLRGPEIAMEYALDYFSKITEDAQGLSSRHNIDFGELIDGLHYIIEVIKNSIL